MATHGPLTDGQDSALREVHDEIPTRDEHWPHDLEGSFAPIDELATVDHLGREWLFSNHGSRDSGVGRPLQPGLHPLDPARRTASP